MNKQDRNKAEEFYQKSEIVSKRIHQTSSIVLNYSDMLRLMHSYAEEQVKINCDKSNVIESSKCDHAFVVANKSDRKVCIKCGYFTEL